MTDNGGKQKDKTDKDENTQSPINRRTRRPTQMKVNAGRKGTA